MADPSGILWDDAPQQAPAAPPQPQSQAGGIAWDDEEQAGPPRADFRNVDAGATVAKSPLQQFTDYASGLADNMVTGAKALWQGGDYETAPNDPRKVIGVGEGMARDAADIASGWANAAIQ